MAFLLRSAQTTRPAPPGRPSRPPATKRARTGDTILGQAEVAELGAEEPKVPPRTPPFFAAARPPVPRLPAGPARPPRRNADAPAVRILPEPQWPEWATS